MHDIVSGSPLFARLDEAGQLRLVLDSSPMAVIVIDDTATTEVAVERFRHLSRAILAG